MTEELQSITIAYTCSSLKLKTGLRLHQLLLDHPLRSRSFDSIRTTPSELPRKTDKDAPLGLKLNVLLFSIHSENQDSQKTSKSVRWLLSPLSLSGASLPATEDQRFSDITSNLRIATPSTGDLLTEVSAVTGK